MVNLILVILVLISVFNINSIHNVNADSTDIESPTAPSHLVKTASTTSSITLAWMSSTDNVEVTGYEVYQGETLVGTTSETTYTVTGLERGQVYTFKVKALDAAGNQSPEGSITASTDGRNLVINAGFETYTGSNGVADNWQHIVAGQSPEVAIETNTVGSGSKAQKITGTGLASGNQIKVYQYFPLELNKPYVIQAKVKVEALANAKVQFHTSFFNDNNAWIAGDAVNVTETTDGYVVFKKNGVVPNDATKGSIGLSLIGTGAEGSGMAYIDDVEFWYGEEDLVVPTAPSHLVKAASTTNSITLAWMSSTDNVGVTGYEVYRGETLVGTTSETTYTVTGLERGQVYTFKVKALDAAGNQSPEGSITASTDGRNLVINAGFVWCYKMSRQFF